MEALHLPDTLSTPPPLPPKSCAWGKARCLSCLLALAGQCISCSFFKFFFNLFPLAHRNIFQCTLDLSRHWVMLGSVCCLGVLTAVNIDHLCHKSHWGEKSQETAVSPGGGLASLGAWPLATDRDICVTHAPLWLHQPFKTRRRHVLYLAWQCNSPAELCIICQTWTPVLTAAV